MHGQDRPLHKLYFKVVISMTEKLYYIDGYLTQFDCKVISFFTDEGLTFIETDKTAFFPEGGGQTSDVGKLGEIQIDDVQIIEDKLFHIAKSTSSAVNELQIGKQLSGKINMAKRFSNMQQHTAEHILCGIAHKLYGFENSGFHLGANVVTMDFDHVITGEQIEEIEKLANEAVWKDVPVKCYFPTPQEAEKIEYRSKMLIEEDLRLVEIEGVDICACCAPHVKFTGEIGIIKIIGHEKLRGGSRLSMLAGERAFNDVNVKLKQNSKISKMLSAKETETAIAVGNLATESRKLKNEVYNSNKEIINFKIKEIKFDDKIIIFDNSLSGNLLRDFTSQVAVRAEEFVAVFAYADDYFRYVIASDNMDARTISKALNEKFSGKGGGDADVAQGSIKGDQSEIYHFLKEYNVV